MMRRKNVMSIVAMLFFAAIAPRAITAGSAAGGDPIDLSGKWRVALDPQNVGQTEGWQNKDFDQTVKLPGTLDDNGLGDPISAKTNWVSTLHDRFWYLRKDYKEYAKPGNVKVPFWPAPERVYSGAAWYSKTVTIPEAWQGRRVTASFERVQWFSTLYLDGKQVGGACDSLAAPHVFDLGILAPGEHKLVARVDNCVDDRANPKRMVIPIRKDAHAISHSTQGNWNGLVGKLTLTATSPVWIDDARVFPNVQNKTARIEVEIGNVTGKPGQGTLAAGDKSVSVAWDAKGGKAQIEVSFGADAQLWDEFNPKLYPVTLTLKGDGAADARQLEVGLREIKMSNAAFYVNGRLTFFRGTHEGCEFPLTAHPPMDVASWTKIFKTIKAYGLNLMRFHSYCPPEAAFVAADQEGVYLQPECSNWGQYSPNDQGPNSMQAFLARETAAIVKAYGNHPSFLLLSSGNEAGGAWQEPLLAWCKEWREKDNRRLYAASTGRWFDNAPGVVTGVDYLIAQRIGGYMMRGAGAWFGGDFGDSLMGLTVPNISHEVGQWCAYPDLSEIDQYTGTLKPGNLEIFRDSLAKHGMLDQAKQFTLASGKWQLACYKEEIEELLRTPGLGGFQLLDLHDYPGQGTAPVGVLNVFWKPKGYVTPEQFRRFCAPIVPLARVRQLIYSTAQKLDVPVEIANFSAGALKGAVAQWKVVDDDGKVVAKGELPAKDVPIGNGIQLGQVTQSLAPFAAPGRYKLVVGLKGMKDVENDWSFWVYPTEVATTTPPDVLVTGDLDAALASLHKGGKVFFCPANDMLTWDSPPFGKAPTVTPIFWNVIMNPKWERTVGLVIQKDHPALAEFVTDDHYDWQWQDIVIPNRRGMNMDRLPKALKPIVQPIDEWNRNYKLAFLFEAKVGQGRLMACSLDLQSNLNTRLAARQLLHGILDYMGGDKFQPSVELTDADLGQFIFDNRIMRKLGATSMSGDAAIDGNPNTAWGVFMGRGGRAPDPAMALMGGQQDANALVIDFPKPVAMRGVVVMDRQNDRNRLGDIKDYSLQASDDGQAWTEVKSGELESTWEPQAIEFGNTISTRHLKLAAKSVYGSPTPPALAELAVLYAGPKLGAVAAPSVNYAGARGTTAEVDEGVSVPVNANNPTSAMVLSVSADNATADNPALNVLDGVPGTYWLTGKGEGSPNGPHWIKMRFRQPIKLAGIQMTPRQDASAGMPRQFTVAVSDDGKTWKDVLSGDFAATSKQQTIHLKDLVMTNYMRLTIESNFDAKPPVAIAELGVITQQE
jgi:hypothetical protein